VPPYPLIEFELWVGTYTVTGEAYPDTGFDSGNLIPLGVGREILADPDWTPVRLADGTVRLARSWTGKVGLGEHTFSAEVVALGNRFLLGREVLDRLEICFEFGRQVRLRFRDT
jgi:hypothetical protein